MHSVKDIHDQHGDAELDVHADQYADGLSVHVGQYVDDGLSVHVRVGNETH